MVTKESVEEQLKKIGFNYLAWGRTEVRELPNVLMSDEEIFECVNGLYEGGFALLVATNFRVILIDKKPMNYLTVEDLRFDMISEIDYSHRLFGARISISTGSKNLKFTSYNQPRLRKLISHVQHCMADNKKQQAEHQEDQKLHLEQINQQLQAYLLAQHQQQEKLHQQLRQNNIAEQPITTVEPVQPSPELSDYLYAQSLLAKHQEVFQQAGSSSSQAIADGSAKVTLAPAPLSPRAQPGISSEARMADLYAEGMQEVFGKHQQPEQQDATASPALQTQPQVPAPAISPIQRTTRVVQHALDINPLTIAYSKLPMALRNRKFGRPSFHAHSQAEEEVAPTPAADAAPASY